MKRTALLPALALVTAVGMSSPFLACSGKSTNPAEDSGILLNGHRESVNSVDFAPDGSRLVSGGADSTIRIWDVDAHTLVRTIDCRSKVSFVRYSATGDSILAIQSGEVTWWDAETGVSVADAPVVTGLQPPYAFSASRNTLASGSGIDGRPDVPGSAAYVHDAVSGQLRGTFSAGDGELLYAISLSADGDLLAVAYWHGRIEDEGFVTQATIAVWSVESNEVQHAFPAGGSRFSSLAFSHDNELIIGAPADRYERSVKVWDVSSGELASVLQDTLLQAQIRVAVSRAGASIAASSPVGNVYVWNFAEDVPQYSFPVPAGISELAFSRDGLLLAGAGTWYGAGEIVYRDTSLHLWELEP